MESPRRVLAPRDANVNMAVASSTSALPLSPPATIEPKKRALDAAAPIAETPSKRTCLPSTATPNANTNARVSRPSLSPATSPVFNLSGTTLRTSQGSSMADAAAPHHASALREQSRQRAEILKLRLGLARYKVRTGQVDVPLERLRVVPTATQRYILQGRQQSTRLLLPPCTPQRRWQQPERHRHDDDEDSNDQHDNDEEDADANDGEDDLPQQPRCQLDSVNAAGGEDDDDLPQRPHIRPADADPESKSLPRLLTTPRGNRQLIEPADVSSSAMHGSAVSGLLSLARS